MTGNLERPRAGPRGGAPGRGSARSGALAALERWACAQDFGRGHAAGVAWRSGALRPAGAPAGREEYADPFGHGCVTWEYGRWTSPWVELPFTATDIVPSWTADAPDGARLTVRLQVRDPAGAVSPWYVLAHWCAGDALVHRATVPGQGDAHGRVDVDTFTAGAAGVVAYRLAADLAAAAGGGTSAALTGLYAVASRAPAPDGRVGAKERLVGDGRCGEGGRVGGAWAVQDPSMETDRRTETGGRTGARAQARAGRTQAPVGAGTSPGGPAGSAGSPRGRAARGMVLDVPGRSQGAHTGHCPQWDGGGEAWAGPACTAMLVEFFGYGPGPADLAWLDPEDPAPQVDFAARQVYDHAYRGCGNWAFNAAYPARFGLRGMVVRLLSLADLEGFVAAGVPVATSLALRSSELSGPGRSYTTAGNIVVVCGFTAAGDVVVNDPLATADDEVRRVYPRAGFARVWLCGSGAGAAYLVHPAGLRLPPHPGDGPPRW